MFRYIYNTFPAAADAIDQYQSPNAVANHSRLDTSYPSRLVVDPLIDRANTYNLTMLLLAMNDKMTVNYSSTVAEIENDEDV